MAITIRERVRVAADRSVHVSNPLLEPGANADVIVQVNAGSASGTRYCAFDVMRAHPIDAPENYSTSFDDELRL